MVLIYGLSWDERAEDHIARHGVDIDEVEEAVRNIKHAKRSSDYLMVIGQSEGGRYLVVILDYDGDHNWYVVTARDADKSERKLLSRISAAKGK